MADSPVKPSEDRPPPTAGPASPAVLLLDRAGIIRGATPEACAALVRPLERLLARPLHEFLPKLKAQVYPWLDALAKATDVPPPRLMDVEAECVGQNRSFDGVLYATLVGGGQAPEGVVAGLKLRPSSLLLARTQALDAQQTLLEQIARGATLRDTLREVARFAERQMPSETFCAIVTTDERCERLERAVVAGLPRDMSDVYAGGSLHSPESPAAQALSSQRPVIAVDFEGEPAWARYSDTIRRHSLRAVWSYPVKPGAGMRRAALDFLLTAQRAPNASESRMAEQMTGLVSLALDLHHLREELAARSANLASIVGSLPVVLWETDAAGVLTLIDGGALATVKLHAADVVGRTSDQAFGASDATQGLVRRALAGESAWADVATLGRIFAIGVAPIRDASGAVSGMRGLALDITARKDAERAVRESVERLNLVIDASRDGFWDFRLEGEGSMVSDRCARMLGYDPGEVPVATPDRHPLVHADDRALVAVAWNDHLAGRTARYECEHRRLAADGTVRWILERGQVVERAPDGQALRVAGTQSDVTHRRTLEQSALTAQKMDALAQVSRGFAQDLANVLAAIRGHAALGALSNGLPPRVAESLEVIQLAAARGRALTQNMMALGTPAPIQRRVTGVLASLHETLRLLTPVIPPQVAVNISDATDGDDRVVVDPNLLQQVLLNLLLRARDAMPSGGTLAIAVDRAPRDGHASDVRVRIEDTGIGIAPEDLPHVFDPFHVRTGGGVGTGLALALVRSFVDSCGGRIDVRSSPGQGSAFTMTLPGADVGRADVTAQRPLVVLGEGHPLLRPMLAEALQQCGYDVNAAATREAFLSSLSHLRHRTGAVVVEGTFLGLAPSETIRRVTECAGRIVPVIMAVGAHEMTSPIDGIELISKPIDLEAVRQRLDHSLHVREPAATATGPGASANPPD